MMPGRPKGGIALAEQENSRLPERMRLSPHRSAPRRFFIKLPGGTSLFYVEDSLFARFRGRPAFFFRLGRRPERLPAT